MSKNVKNFKPVKRRRIIRVFIATRLHQTSILSHRGTDHEVHGSKLRKIASSNVSQHANSNQYHVFKRWGDLLLYSLTSKFTFFPSHLFICCNDFLGFFYFIAHEYVPLNESSFFQLCSLKVSKVYVLNTYLPVPPPCPRGGRASSVYQHVHRLNHSSIELQCEKDGNIITFHARKRCFTNQRTIGRLSADYTKTKGGNCSESKDSRTAYFKIVTW